MKLTAKLNGVQQEIELTKEDVYVVECGDKEQTTKATNSTLRQFDKTHIPCNWTYWKYVLFNKNAVSEIISNSIEEFEPIPPNTPIISFEDWERLMECKELPKEFCFVCDENSKGQIQKLEIYSKNWGIERFGLTYYVSDNSMQDYKDSDGWYFGRGKDVAIISLADYLPTETDKEESAPTQKWEKLTRGGIKVLDIQITFDDYIVVKAQKDDREIIYICYSNGINKGGNSNFDLIPLNRESILKEIEEHKQAIVELEKKLL